MWVKQLLLALIGLSAGVTVAGGLFSFVVSLETFYLSIRFPFRSVP